MAYKQGVDLGSVTQYDVLVGDLDNKIASVGPGNAGQVLQSGGNAANPSYSTATFPSTATGTGKILRADGTNWVASTATYPDTAGTSTNVLQSDGTNWSSVAFSGGLGYAIDFRPTAAATPLRLTTYFLTGGGAWNHTASGTASTRIYIPVSGTIKAIYGFVCVEGSLGSSENSTLELRLNNTTDTTITSTIKMNAASNAFNAAVSISVSAGDYIEYKLTTPNWVSVPGSPSYSITTYID